MYVCMYVYVCVVVDVCICVDVCLFVHDRELVRAVQNRNNLLEDDCKRLSTEVDNLNNQMEAKDKVSNVTLYIVIS